MNLEQAYRMARHAMDVHGLTDWGLGLDRAKVRAGACHFTDRRITLSRALTLAHDEEQVRETVLHEIAHALVGPRHGHDQVWRAKALSIGATGQRCWVGGEGSPAVPGRWVGRCAGGHEVQRHRRPSRVLLCLRCRGLDEIDRVLEWWHDGRPVPLEQMGPQVVRDLQHLRSRRRGKGVVG